MPAASVCLPILKESVPIRLLTDALDTLVHLSHRGGTGAELDTGDGAGILTQIPDTFFRKVCALEGMLLPAIGEYGVGMFFLSVDDRDAPRPCGRSKRSSAEYGQTFLGWRNVPVNPSTLGLFRESLHALYLPGVYPEIAPIWGMKPRLNAGCT